MSSHNRYRWLTSRSHPSRSTGRCCRIAVVSTVDWARSKYRPIVATPSRDKQLRLSDRVNLGLAAVTCTFNVSIEVQKQDK